MVRQVFMVAALVAKYGERVAFVDIRIETSLIQAAVDSGKVKQFFNRRFHDMGVDWPRLVYFVTASRRKERRRKRGPSNLHCHAVVVRPERVSNAQMRKQLRDVFGKTPMKIEKQIDISKPDPRKGFTWNGVNTRGVIGKILYVQEGMGTTYNDLKYNEDGKRSRKAPPDRREYNKHSTGLAQGIPSNFNSKATLCDTETKQLAETGFKAWIASEKAQAKAEARKSARQVTAKPSSKSGNLKAVAVGR